jgi:hypothetical protein
LQFVIVFWREEVLSAFNGKHNMDVYLRVGICHGPKIPNLTVLGNIFWMDFYKYCAPDGAGGKPRRMFPAPSGAPYL